MSTTEISVIKDGAVTEAKIGTGAVTADKIGSGAVTADKIAAGAARITGEVVSYVGTIAPSGWVLLNGTTIGNASSGAAQRANADTEDLFTLLWNSMADSEAAVSSGRGGSAAADYAANKTITLPDVTGRVIAGLEASATRLTSGGSGIDGATLGDSGGTQTHTLTTTEMPSHAHGAGSLTSYSSGSSGSGGVAAATAAGSAAISGSTGSAGSGGAHQNTQPTLVLNYIIKL